VAFYYAKIFWATCQSCEDPNKILAARISVAWKLHKVRLKIKKNQVFWLLGVIISNYDKTNMHQKQKN